MKNLNILTILSIIILMSCDSFSQELDVFGFRADYSIPPKPDSPFSNPLAAGTYTIGVEGYFPTIDSAFRKLSLDGISGEVSLELIDELYRSASGSPGFILVGPISGTGHNNRITLKPAQDKNVIIEADGEAVLSFIDVSYFTIDGIDLTGSTTLEIHAIQNDAFNFNDGIIFFNNSKHNTIQNITFDCEDYTRNSGGIVFLHPSGNFTPDSNLIQNNFIKKAAMGICVASFFYKATGNIIRDNVIGSGTDSLISLGINVVLGQYTIVEDNIIQNLSFNSQLPFCSGIVSSGGTGDIIKNNIVHNVNVTNGNYGSSGIFLNGTTYCTGIINSVYNNMIYDIRSSSNDTSAKVSGIELRNQSYAKIYFNTVYLSGTGNNHSGSTSLYIGYGCSNNYLKNNILINTRDESPYYSFAVNDCGSGSLISDYNDLYVGDNQNNFLAGKNGIHHKTLSEWQLNGFDEHSFNAKPQFENPGLHIDRRTEVCIEMTGTPISGITTDIDGEQRNLQTPDIGADEFDCIVSEVANEFFADEFRLEQNYPNPFNPSTKISYSLSTGGNVTLKVFDILGNEIATLVNEEKPAGKYEINFDASNFSSGVYIYSLQTANFYESRKMLLLK